MLAYAASRRRELADRRPHPNMMLLIIGAHVAALAVVMSAKMDLPRHLNPEPLIINTITELLPPPTPAATSKPVQQPLTQVIDPLPPTVKLPPVVDLPPAQANPTVDPGPIAGGGASVIPHIEKPMVTPVRTGPRLLTAASELKPPYPAMKLLDEEEGAVTVRLTINEQGRVIAVDPVGRADPAFLDAARRHLLAHWRFKPASEDGRAVSSSTIVTLHFELNG